MALVEGDSSAFSFLAQSTTSSSKGRPNVGLKHRQPYKVADNIPETIKEVEDLTPEVVDLLLKDHQEKVYFPYLKVDKDEFKRLEEKYPNEHDPGFEYSADDKEIVLLALPTPIHQHITLALQGWLNNIGEEELSTPDRAYFADAECPVMLVDGSSKVPDTALVTSPRGLYPIVAVEVGFSEPLEKLYHDAEVLLRGSRDWIELVIILKIYESGHYQRPSNVYPWDETVERLEAMSDEELASTIEAYFVSNQLRIVGDLTVDVLLYPKSRKTRPRKPVYTFVHPRQDSDQALAPRPPMVSIQGQKFRFPVRKVNLAIERGVAREEARRILDGIREAGLLR